MSVADGVSDSTDWLNTPLAALAPVESSLRCQVCKDFYSTPMMTSCSHTFCSLCIRRYLSQEGRCPTCREPDQEIKLRRNWVVEEMVAQFRVGRDSMLKFARTTAQQQQRQQEEGEAEGRPVKRRKLDAPQESGRRSTRSQSRRIISSDEHLLPSTPQEVLDNQEVAGEEEVEEDSEYEDAPNKKQRMKDGLVTCPICSKRVKEALINAHIDSNCTSHHQATASPSRSHTPQTTSLAHHGHSRPAQALPPQSQAHAPTTATATTTTTPRDRLPTINYSMLSETALRKKLRELNIPAHGSKELMRRRHTEWMNLWNANCDARDPAPTRTLLQTLDRWERTLGKQVDRGPSGVMLKEFDRDSWQKTNRGEFDDLIRKARESRKTVGVSGGEGNSKSDGGAEGSGEVGVQEHTDVDNGVNKVEDGNGDSDAHDVAMADDHNTVVGADRQVEDLAGAVQGAALQPLLNPVNMLPITDTAQKSGTDVDQIQTH